MLIHRDFEGGNIVVQKTDGNDIYLERELRDTATDWFYWAFCIEDAGDRVLTFHFSDQRLGYFGPAVSFDFENWFWLDSGYKNSFSFDFTGIKGKVYFAHHILYPTNRFSRLCGRFNRSLSCLCISKRGRKVPFIEIGKAEKTVFLTARHHACESTGSYVLEGVTERILEKNPTGYRFVIIPFVDYDGVIDGDQGKNRTPYDHNRDYPTDKDSIYPETKRIRELADSSNIVFGCDFHSPGHIGFQNDTCFIVCNDCADESEFKVFGDIFESHITKTSFDYKCSNNYPFGKEWNNSSKNQFASYMGIKGADLSFSLETSYYGTENNKITAQNMLELGRCFADAMFDYLKNR